MCVLVPSARMLGFSLVSLGIKFGPVAAVGRMAFTIYITCSLIGTTLAGWRPLCMFGEVSLSLPHRVTIAPVVVC
jgi:uncharacterized membrane protein YeiB